VIVPGDGAAFAHAVAAAYAADTKSVVTFVAISTLDAHGGPFHVRTFSETAYEEAGGVPVRKRVLRFVDGGRTAAPDELAKRSTTADVPSSRFGMRLPICLGSVDDYVFGKPYGDGDVVSVDFRSNVRDAAHGDGSISFLRDENRIATVVIRPAILPEHATSMTTTLDFGLVTDDRWDVVKVTHQFTGREGFISGAGVSITTYERYRPFASESAADAVLDTMQPASG
jgi:hypothetical protein